MLSTNNVPFRVSRYASGNSSTYCLSRGQPSHPLALSQRKSADKAIALCSKITSNSPLSPYSSELSIHLTEQITQRENQAAAHYDHNQESSKFVSFHSVHKQIPKQSLTLNRMGANDPNRIPPDNADLIKQPILTAVESDSDPHQQEC